jgi:hypothetical protein
VADRNSIRNEYLKNLQLETSNNLTNYNANQIFKQTGVLPPSITALVDTRSITEKYADKQKARVAVLSGLREITDGANANQIIDQIKGNDIVDLLNNLPQIIAEIKPKWSLGITAPAFMAYWNRYKQALTMNAGVSTLAVLQSNQLLTNIQGLLQNIQATLATKQDYTLLKSVFSLLPQTEEVQRATQMIQDAENDTQTVYSLATEMSIRGTKDPLTFEQQIQDLNSAVESLPPRSAIVDLTQQAQIISQLGNSPQEANELASQARGQLAVENPSSFRTLQKGFIPKEFIEEEGEEGETPSESGSPATPSSMTASVVPNNPPKNMKEFNQLTQTEKRAFLVFLDRNDPTFKRSKDLSNMAEPTKNPKKFGSLYHITWLSPDSLNYVDRTNVMGLVENFFNSKGKLTITTDKKGKPNTYGNILSNYKYVIEKNKEKQKYKEPPIKIKITKPKLTGAQESKSSGTEPPLDPNAEDIEKAMTGTGIKRKHRIQGRGVNAHRTHAETTTLTSGGNYRRIPKVDTSHKVEKVPSYIQFGKHLLHQHNLLGGILQIRRHSGNIINELPRQSIGGKLRNVLIKLTGTGSPSFEDINELSSHEKEILNKVVKHCKIDQRLLVPTPDKTKEEQDMNRLQILSGEITAGNNNPTIVKELKTLLLRLKNSGRIPKREAHEIMEDLLTLGY